MSKEFCVYLTSYYGNKLPMFYIGSGTVKKVESGYHGSVRSKKYQPTWDAEIKNNPHLFKTKIIKTFEDRKSATELEHNLQVAMNVVKSDMYINMAFAAVNGFFGMPVSGKDHPLYGIRGDAHWGTGQKRPEHSEKVKNKKQTDENKRKKSISNTGKPHGNGKSKLPQQWINDDTFIKKYTEILRIYRENPELDIPHGYKGKNGHMVTYEIAFGHTYAEQFGMPMQKINLFLKGKMPVFLKIATEILENSYGN